MFILILFLIFCSVGCSNLKTYNEAVKKHGTAKYYFDHKDYVRADRFCREALSLWKQLKASNLKEVPEWSIDQNIKSCENLLESIPTPGLLSAMTVVPLEVYNNRIYVEARLNQVENVRLLLDTGASCTVINPDVAASLGISPDKDDPVYPVSVFGGAKVDVPYVKLRKIRVGEAFMENLLVGVYLAISVMPSTDGILGTDFLGAFSVSIDQHNGKLTLKSHEN